MTEKVGVAHPYLIICELCELCEQMPSVNFYRKVSMLFRKSCERDSSRKINFENFDKFCSNICIYQKLFVSLQTKIVSYRMKNIPIKRFLSCISGFYLLDNQHFTPPIRFVSM